MVTVQAGHAALDRQSLEQGKVLRDYLRPIMRFKRDRAQAERKAQDWKWADCLALALIIAAHVLTIGVLLYAFLAAPAPAQADEPMIDLTIIASIESSNNPWAWRKADDSRGLYQITPICLKEYRNFHPKCVWSMDDMWDPDKNYAVARWMLEVRIPQMLRHFKKPETLENRLIAYNAGISYVVSGKRLPTVTQNYIRKYKAMVK